MLPLSFVLLLSLGAGKTHLPDRSKIAPFLTRLREDAGFRFAECRSLRCVRKAERTCRPVHLQKAQSTLEGAPTVTDFFVQPLPAPQKGQCHVAVFEDRTADVFSGCRIVLRSCATLADALEEGPQPKPCPEVEVFRDVPCGSTGAVLPDASARAAGVD